MKKEQQQLKFKEQLKKDLKLIEEWYLKVWKAVKAEDMKEAISIIYYRMPTKLYDLSIDILYNRNVEFSNEELRHLIEKVDKALCEESEEEDLQEDDFKGQF